MSSVAFGDKEHPPTTQEMVAAVGSKRPLWDRLSGFITSNYTVRQDLKFYGKNFGWLLQYRRGGRLLLSLYPKRDALAVQVILSEPDWEAALRLPLGERTAKALREASHYTEGCWMVLEMESEGDAADIEQLVLLKSPPPRRRGKAAESMVVEAGSPAIE
jgi:hypothetical protein